jgi:hypothetical protein
MRLALIPALVFYIVPVWAADEAMLRLVPPGVSTIAGADFDRARSSPLGQTVLEVLNKENDDLEKFIAATGFDPRRDIREVIAAGDRIGPHSSPGPGQNSHRQLFIARGVFDEARILGSASVFGGLVNSYQGFRLLTPPREKAVEIAFLGNMVVAGQPVEVRAAVDRHVAKAPPSEAAARALSLSQQYDAWAITGAVSQFVYQPPHSSQAGAAAKNALTSIQSVTAGFRFGGYVDVTAEAVTRSEQDAAALIDLYRLAVMMLQSQTQSRRSEEAIAVDKLIESVSATADGKSARFSASVPSEMVEKWIRAGSRRGGRPSARVSPKPAAAR